MSKSRPRYRRKVPRKGPCGCCPRTGKIRYLGLKSARDAIKALESSGKAAGHPKGDRPLQAYWCFACRSFHIGHGPEERAKRRA